jgi:hypothetical protein
MPPSKSVKGMKREKKDLAARDMFIFVAETMSADDLTLYPQVHIKQMDPVS